MPIKDMLLPEFDHEMGVTRRVLERIPQGEFGWAPHERSRPLGPLAFHVANLPTWAQSILELTEFDLPENPPADAGSATPRATRAELLSQFDRNVASARRIIDRMTDPELMAIWTFKKGGQTVFSMPRISALRSFLMNHSVHHRGQLSVYLRLRNVPVPAMYGPSADEG